MLLSVLKVSFYVAVATMSVGLLISLFFYFSQTPSHDQNWSFGQQKLPLVSISGQDVVIQDLRDYDWLNESSVENYYDVSFSLDDIESLEVGISHFSVHESIAHIFLVFKIKGQEDIGFSVEARRSAGEEYTITGGLKFDFDLAYFLTSKKDLLSIRQQRNERVYLFKTKATSRITQQLFLKLSSRINRLYEQPEFYHVLFKNCATQVVEAIESITDVRFPFYEKTFAPGFSGKALFDMGLIDTNLTSFEQVKSASLVVF